MGSNVRSTGSYKAPAVSSLTAFLNVRGASWRLVGETNVATRRSTAPARARAIFASSDKRFHFPAHQRREAPNSNVHKCGRSPLCVSQSRKRVKELNQRSRPSRQAVTSAFVNADSGARAKSRLYAAGRPLASSSIAAARPLVLRGTREPLTPGAATPSCRSGGRPDILKSDRDAMELARRPIGMMAPTTPPTLSMGAPRRDGTVNST